MLLSDLLRSSARNFLSNARFVESMVVLEAHGHDCCHFIQADGRLGTESLFIRCLDLVQLWQPMTPDDHTIGGDDRKDKPAVQQIRKSLDRGQGVSSSHSQLQI